MPKLALVSGCMQSAPFSAHRARQSIYGQRRLSENALRQSCIFALSPTRS